MYEHHSEEYRGFTIRICADEDAPNPFLEYDAEPKVVHWHRRYDLGDQYPETFPHPFHEREAAIEAIKAEYGARVVKPLYLYDHSIQRVSTGSFIGRAQHAEWDSGQVGFVFDTPKMRKDGWGDDVTDEELDRAIEGSVETFDQYLRGGVMGYIVEHPDLPSFCGDSCWGFFGEMDDVIAEAKSVIDSELDHIAKEDAKIDRIMAL